MKDGTSRATAFAVVTVTGAEASAEFADDGAASFVFSFALAFDAERPPHEIAPKSASESANASSARDFIRGEMQEADINGFINL